MGVNRELLGKTYDPQVYPITAEETRKYAYGYNEDLPLFMEESRAGGIISPPMFGVKYAGASIVAVFFDPAFNVNFARLVHGEQTMDFLGTVRPGDTISTVGRIAAIEEKSTGETFTVETVSTNQDGASVLRTLATFFIRGEKSGASRKKPPEPQPERTCLFEQDMAVRENQTYIYADGSGDNNPIHVDPEFATKVGLPGIILQGLCTMAFCFKAVQDNVCDRDPRRIKHLRVRFAKPVLPLDTVTTRAWVEEKADGLTTLGFETANQRGDLVIKNGLAKVANP